MSDTSLSFNTASQLDTCWLLLYGYWLHTVDVNKAQTQSIETQITFHRSLYVSFVDTYWITISVDIVMYFVCCPGIFVCTDRECNIILGSCQEFLHYPGMHSCCGSYKRPVCNKYIYL